MDQPTYSSCSSASSPATPAPAALPELTIARFNLQFAASRPYRIEGYRGSAWRGVLGHALRRLACMTREKSCPGCVLYRSCIYSYIFETPPPPGSAKLSRYTAAPHPFVLVVPAEAPVGLAYGEQLGLNLFGRGANYLAYLVRALQQAAEEGLRPENVPLRLAAVEQEDVPGSGHWTPIFDGQGSLAPEQPAQATWPEPWARTRVNIRTPLRLRRNNDLITPESFTFADLFSNLLRRISLITYFHTETPLETDFAALVASSREVSVDERRLQWRDWTRYSGRQQTHMQMGGFVGSFTVATGERPELWPYLWLGQWVHAGKGTSMGLGRYDLEQA